MKWAVYWDAAQGIGCEFFRTKEEAEKLCLQLIDLCVNDSMASEKNEHWDITLMEVKGEVHWGPNGLQLEAK